jgi:AraC family transcriptional regulator
MDERAKITRLGFAGSQARDRLTATMFSTTAGVIDSPADPDTLVSLHIGPPIWASCGYEGHVHRRLQSEGDLDLLPAGLAGEWRDEAPATFLLMRLPGAVLAQASGEVARLEPRFQLRDPQLQHIGFALKAELEDESPNGRIYVDALGLALAVHLVARYALPPAPEVKAVLTQGLSTRQKRLVREYVETHLDQDLSMADLARVAGVGVSHFRALFGRSFGLAPHRYVIERRLVRARELIERDAAPLAEVALMAGFSHQSHLARWMRRLEGVTPGELRRKL